MTTIPTPDHVRSAWWVRAVAAIPLAWLYAFARLLAFLADRVFPYRRHVVEANLRIAFPDLDDAALRVLIRDYYRGFADMLVEIIKSAQLSRAEISARVRITNLELLHDLLAKDKPVLCVAAHQCNWEWMLLSFSAQLGYPLDAAYKPLVDSWAEREMLKIRTRFGARLVPANAMLADIIKRRNVPRVIAMVADQEPVNERTQALAAVPQPRLRVLPGSRGDRARDALRGAVHRVAARGARAL